ncbi:MAG: hypothetical protein HYV13_04410 [Candidatus Doudnabacteria bacterium]|nr:hypothetical protein [Candidatus Doudnabacteria bacterium]
MKDHTLKHVNKDKVCELCLRHDPLVKDYSEDFELQTALRNYIEKTSGDKVNITDIARLCDDCYGRVSQATEDEEE